MRLSRKTLTVLELLALAYLGFYVWGLAMSVFTPAGLGILSVVAVVLFVGVVVSAVVERRTQSDAQAAELKRSTAQLRETRGF
jgi:uncharacterized membrane protein